MQIVCCVCMTLRCGLAHQHDVPFNSIIFLNCNAHHGAALQLDTSIHAWLHTILQVIGFAVLAGTLMQCRCVQGVCTCVCKGLVCHASDVFNMC